MKSSKFFSLISVFALVLMLSTSIFAAPANKIFKIGVVHNNADHPSITAIVKGMMDEAQYLPVELIFLDPAYDPQKQASMIEDLITSTFCVIKSSIIEAYFFGPSLRSAKTGFYD